jgi:hypothetical protein
MALSSPWIDRARQHRPDVAIEGVRGASSEPAYREVEVGGRLRRFVLPLTFTPFASARPCSARCVFCSETLVHKDAGLLSASLRPRPGYFTALAAALAALRPLPLGLSLSGLEATDDAVWLETVLDVLGNHEAAGHPFVEKVLYSNGAGLAAPDNGERLIARLVAFGLDRIELSRHHEEAAANDAIMRFRAGVLVRTQVSFEALLARLRPRLHVRLVCVLQRGGVADLGGVRRYLDWAQTQGVTDVVFRELSRLGDQYRENVPLLHVRAARVPIESILEEIWPPGGPFAAGFALTGGKQGYYYWNLEMRYREALDVTFETSDYGTMKERHHSGEIYKLIFHANGALCGDWDPTKDVILAPGATFAQSSS